MEALAKLPYVVAKNAFDRFLTNVVLTAHKRAVTTKAGPARTWLTPSQRGKGNPRGKTSEQGYVPVDTGFLKASIRFKVTPNAGSIGGSGRVFSNVNYANEMEIRRGFFDASKLDAEEKVDDIFEVALKRAKSKFGLKNL